MPRINPVSMTVAPGANSLGRQQALAQAMMSGRAGQQPVRHPMQAVSNFSGKLTGALLARRAERQEQAKRQRIAEALQNMPGASQGGMSQLLAQEYPKLALQQAMEQQQQQQQWVHDAKLLEEKRAYEAANRDAWIKGDNGAVINKYTGETRYPNMPEGGRPPDFEKEKKLRGQYEGINTVKAFRDQAQAYQRVLNSAEDPSGAGDLALIFNYMKVLDPGSTVREGEFAQAAASGAFGDRIQAGIQYYLEGTRLPDEMRQDFVDRAGRLYRGAAELHGKTNERFSRLSKDYGIDPSRIIFEAFKIGILSPDEARKKLAEVNSDVTLEEMDAGAAGGLPEGVTEEDIRHTMKKHNVTREEVLERLNKNAP